MPDPGGQEFLPKKPEALPSVQPKPEIIRSVPVKEKPADREPEDAEFLANVRKEVVEVGITACSLASESGEVEDYNKRKQRLRAEYPDFPELTPQNLSALPKLDQQETEQAIREGAEALFSREGFFDKTVVPDIPDFDYVNGRIPSEKEKDKYGMDVLDAMVHLSRNEREKERWDKLNEDIKREGLANIADGLAKGTYNLDLRLLPQVLAGVLEEDAKKYPGFRLYSASVVGLQVVYFFDPADALEYAIEKCPPFPNLALHSITAEDICKLYKSGEVDIASAYGDGNGLFEQIAVTPKIKSRVEFDKATTAWRIPPEAEAREELLAPALTSSI